MPEASEFHTGGQHFILTSQICELIIDYSGSSVSFFGSLINYFLFYFYLVLH